MGVFKNSRQLCRQENMQHLKDLLGSVVAKSTFDMGHTELTIDGPETIFSSRPEETISPEQLSRIFHWSIWEDPEHERARKALMISSEESLTDLENYLRFLLDEYIDPETGRIGYAMPHFGKDSNETPIMTSDGMRTIQTDSPLNCFAQGLVRGAAILGVERAATLLSEWLQGQPIKYRTCAILNGIFLSEPVESMVGLRLDPLPQSDGALPIHLPQGGGLHSWTYAGHTMLSIDCTASPVFFRPPANPRTLIVQMTPTPNLSIDTICQGLSLSLNNYVNPGLFWNNYQELAAFFPSGRTDSWMFMGKEIKRRHSAEQHASYLNEDKFPNILELLEQPASNRLRIAISRWINSVNPWEHHLADKLIDLRIAIESLFLHDFQNERNRNQEMRLRLSLFGAWYLGSDFQERKSIRKKLIDIYDKASAAAHVGEVEFTEENQQLLSEAQALCRLGILKLLSQGPPSDWGDLILGAEL